MERLKKFTGDALVDIKRKLIHRTKFIGQIGGVFIHGYQNSNFSLSDTQCVSRGIKDNPNIVSGIHGRLRYDYHLLMVGRVEAAMAMRSGSGCFCLRPMVRKDRTVFT